VSKDEDDVMEQYLSKDGYDVDFECVDNVRMKKIFNEDDVM
jgi:hypothetical protein